MTAAGAFPLALLALAAGCRSPGSPWGYAPVVQSASPGIGMTAEGEHRPGAVDPREPRVTLETMILSASPETFAGIEGLTGAGLQKVPPEAAAELEKLRAAGKIREENSCPIGPIPGGTARWINVRQASYVKDFEMVRSGGKILPNPVIGVVQTGASIEARAGVVDGAIALEGLEVQVARLLGMRSAAASIEAEGEFVEASWEEPVVLREWIPAGPVQSRLGNGEMLAVRLASWVEQGCAAARGYARGGLVEERYESRLPEAERDEAPLRREYRAFLRARIEAGVPGSTGVSPPPPQPPPSPPPPAKSGG